MKLMFWLLAFSGYIITTQSSLNTIVANPGGIGGIYRGPNSETLIQGPDGSLITAQEASGSIQTDSNLQPIVVADEVTPLASPTPGILTVTSAPPLEQVICATSAPLARSVAPILTERHSPYVVDVVQQDAHVIETEVVDRPAIEPQQSSDLVGPSGSISTRGSSSVISGPASTTISEPAKVLVAVPAIKTSLHPSSYLELNREVLGSSSLTASRDYASIGADLGNLGLHLAPPSSPPILQENNEFHLVSTGAPPVVSSISSTNFDALSAVSIKNELGTNEINLVSTVRPPQVSSEYGASTDSGNYNPLTSTLAPPPSWSGESGQQPQIQVTTPSIIDGQVVVSTLAPNSSNGDRDIVQPISSNGVIDNSAFFARVSSTPSPGLVYSSPASPVFNFPPPRLSGEVLGDNKQLALDPSNIPSRNILPPEIGPISQFPTGAPHLGATLQVSSTPRAPGLAQLNVLAGEGFGNVARPHQDISSLAAEENVQAGNLVRGWIQPNVLAGEGIGTVARPRQDISSLAAEENFQAGNLVRGWVLGDGETRSSSGSVLLLRDTNPISGGGDVQRSSGSSSDGAEVPLGPGDYDDRASAVLWNRYGRRSGHWRRR